MFSLTQAIPYVGAAIGLIIILGFLAVGAVVLAGIAAFAIKKRTGVDISDGIDAQEWETIKNVYKTQIQREKVATAKERMIVAANDGEYETE